MEKLHKTPIIELDYKYPGNELDLFSQAKNWKKYWSKKVKPQINGKVLEVGSGIGQNHIYLHNRNVSSWTCVEPDSSLYQKIKIKKEQNNSLINRCILGTLKDVPLEKFDYILYIDVLEHIENDQKEILDCIPYLNERGKIITLSPAYNLLFSNHDRSVGHFRRYNTKSLKALQSRELQLTEIIYLDSMGLWLNLANRFILKSSLPTKKQIFVWDKIIVPISLLLDFILFYKVGRSVLGIYELQK